MPFASAASSKARLVIDFEPGRASRPLSGWEIGVNRTAWERGWDIGESAIQELHTCIAGRQADAQAGVDALGFR